MFKGWSFVYKNGVYCGKINVHHRKLCPKKYGSEEVCANTLELSQQQEKGVTSEENVLISSGEMVLMQTASTEVKNTSNGKSEQIRILLDSGSQRTYISESLAKKLGTKREKEQELRLVTFGSEKQKVIKTCTTLIHVKLNKGEYLEISANIVPVISGNIRRKQLSVHSNENLQHLLKSLDMSDTIPTSEESSSVDLLIGNDY